MTIEEISNTLPNGFHDAYIQRLSIDYAKHEAVFALEVCVGDSDSKDAAKRDEYRSGSLKLNGLLFCVIDPPDNSYLMDYLSERDGLWVTSDSSDFGLLESYPKLPELDNGFRHWFFISTLNCFMYVAAMSASFEWE